MTKKNTKSNKLPPNKKPAKKIAKKKNHISDMSVQDLNFVVRHVEPADVASWKVAQKDYEKYYKLGMKYAKEFNKIALAKRKETAHNKDQQIGWSDGFVEAALSNVYNGIDTQNYDHYHGASLKNET